MNQLRIGYESPGLLRSLAPLLVMLDTCTHWPMLGDGLAGWCVAIEADH